MKLYAIYARLCAGIMLLIVWGLMDSPLSGVIFILILTALSAIKYRIKSFKWLPWAETAACLGFALVWFPSVLGLWVNIIGFLEYKWASQEKELLKQDFYNRTKRFELEHNKELAFHELQNAKRIIELTERTRIAQDIHDHAGHEITGALIALQTAVKLYEAGDARTGELLTKTVARLESALENLRETVHNLKPVKKTGIDLLKEICNDFEFCKISFISSGNLQNTEYWDMLAANLKEALTNVSRHSDADLVTVKLDGNDDYLRMEISNNNRSGNFDNPRFGLGLTGMHERIRAVNGTIVVNTENGFKIICMIPKKG